VVTSDFHSRRAELTFKQVFPAQKVVVHGATALLSSVERINRVEHEDQTLHKIEQVGGVINPHSTGHGA